MKRSAEVNKRRSRGASPRVTAQMKESRFSALASRLRVFFLRLVGVIFGRWMFLAVSVLGGAYLAYGGQHYISQIIDRPVAQINVNGEFSYVSRQQVIDVVSPAINQHFLQLDLAGIKEVLEQEAWVDKASVGRRWPNQLDVSIVEQKPIARWSDRGFLNQRGELIETQLGSELMALPMLNAEAHSKAEVMAQYQDLAVLLRSRNLLIGGLVSDDKRAWTVSLPSGLEIRVGRNQVMEKMKRFLQVYDEELRQHINDVESVDVRYSNGVAVRWRDEAAGMLTTQVTGK